MKASEIIRQLTEQIRASGDLEVTCKAGDSYYPSRFVTYDSDDNEIIIECKS